MCKLQFGMPVWCSQKSNLLLWNQRTTIAFHFIHRSGFSGQCQGLQDSKPFPPLSLSSLNPKLPQRHGGVKKRVHFVVNAVAIKRFSPHNHSTSFIDSSSWDHSATVCILLLHNSPGSTVPQVFSRLGCPLIPFHSNLESKFVIANRCVHPVSGLSCLSCVGLKGMTFLLDKKPLLPSLSRIHSGWSDFPCLSPHRVPHPQLTLSHLRTIW